MRVCIVVYAVVLIPCARFENEALKQLKEDMEELKRAKQEREDIKRSLNLFLKRRKNKWKKWGESQV